MLKRTTLRQARTDYGSIAAHGWADMIPTPGTGFTFSCKPGAVHSYFFPSSIALYSFGRLGGVLMAFRAGHMMSGGLHCRARLNALTHRAGQDMELGTDGRAQIISGENVGCVQIGIYYINFTVYDIDKFGNQTLSEAPWLVNTNIRRAISTCFSRRPVQIKLPTVLEFKIPSVLTRPPIATHARICVATNVTQGKRSREVGNKGCVGSFPLGRSPSPKFKNPSATTAGKTIDRWGGKNGILNSNLATGHPSIVTGETSVLYHTVVNQGWQVCTVAPGLF